MNLLFEIPDKVLIIVGAIFVLFIIIVAAIIKNSGRKVKPISEDDRYDNNEPIKVREITNDELSDEQKEAKEELARVFNQMSADLEKQKLTPDEIDDFEREQEENAIISYQELLAQAEKLKEKADTYEKMAETKAGMKVKEALSTYEKHEVKKQEKIQDNSKKQVQTFKSSDIVSPIYGIQSNKNMVRQKKSSKKENRDIISKAYQQDLFEEEKTQNLDFLNSLKEFRKNL